MSQGGVGGSPAVRISVGINIAPTYENFRRGLSMIVDSINKTPYKIQFKLDESSISAATNRLLEINKAMENAGAKTPVSQVNSIKSQISEIQRAYQTFSNLSSINKNDFAFVSLGQNLEKCDALLKSCGSDTSKFLKTFAVDGAAGKQILDQMTAAMQQLQGTSNAYLKTNGLTDRALTSDYTRLAPQLQSAGMTTELATLRTQYNELILLTEQWKASGASTNDPTYANIINKRIALRQLINTQQEAIATTVRANAANKENAKTQSTEVATLKRYATAVSQGEKYLRNWSKAENSKNATSRTAYQQLRDSVIAMQNAKAAYDQGTGSIRTLDNAVRNYKATLSSSQRIIQANGDATKTLTERFGGFLSTASYWFSTYQIIMYGVRTIRKMITTSIELDSAMTQMQIVTKSTGAEMRKFGDDATEAAKKTASSITDIVDSATTYARLGYSLSESTQLAKYTSMLKNVGDIEVSDAQDAITAIVKAYNIGANDIESVMDKLVETGNNFPISVSEIAEGMNNASSSLSAAGNSFEQSVALLTAANTTIQNAAKASTGLRTITARLRKTKTELDDLGEAMTDSEYNELIEALSKHNVSIVDDAGEFRDTYSIMKDISEIWGELSSMEQAGIANLASGTRQQAIFYSMIQNFDNAKNSMDAMANSSGALDDAYSVYLGSAQAHVDQFKATFETLSKTVMNSGLIKFVVDGGSTIINFINLIMDKLGGLPALIAGIFGAIKARSIGMFSTVRDTVTGYVKSLSFKSPFASFISGIRSEKVLTSEDVFGVNFSQNLQNDKAALEEYRTVISKTGSAVEAEKQCLGGASTALRTYISETKASNLDAEKFEQQTRASSVALYAQNASLKDARGIINTYRSGCQGMGMSQAQFADAVGKTNPLLAQAMVNTNSAKGALLQYGVSLFAARVKTIALQAASMALNMALSMGVAAVIQLIITGLTNLIKLIPTVENTMEALSNSAQEVTDITSKIESLNDELDTTRQRIDELLKKDKLSFVEQDELEQLERTSDELERKIALEERQLQVSQRKKADDFVSNINSIKKDAAYVGGTYRYAEEEHEMLFGYYKRLREEYDSISDLSLEDEVWWTKKLDDASKDLDKYADKFREALNTFGDYDYSTLSDSAKEAIDYANNFLNKYLIAISDKDNRSKAISNVFSNIYNSESNSSAKEAIQKLAKNNPISAEGLEKLSDTNSDVEKFIDNLIELGVVSGRSKNDFAALIDYIASTDKKVESDTGVGATLDSLAKAVSEYEKQTSQLQALGFNENDTVFGNIDMNKRGIFKFTEENIDKYKTELSDWVDVTKQSADDVATVLGGFEYFNDITGDVDEKNGVPIAFSPMLQTPDGVEILSWKTVKEYIKAVLQRASQDGEWTQDEIFRIDAQGLDIDGKHIKSILAAVGNDAERVSQSMHYVGAGGSLDQAKQKVNALSGAFAEAVTASQSFGVIKDSLEDINKDLDTAQSAYKTAASVITDYNKTGVLSLDNLQSLLELEPQYLNCLVTKDGALSLNKKSYQDVTNAMLEQYKISAQLTALNELAAIDDKTKAQEMLAKYTTGYNEVQSEALELQWQTIFNMMAMKDLAENTDVYTKLASERYLAYQKTALVIDAMKSSVRDNIDLTLGATNAEKAEKAALSETKKALEQKKNALSQAKTKLEAYKNALDKQKDRLEKQKDGYEKAQDAIQSLVDTTVDWIKQTKQDEIDAIEKKKDAFDELIDKEVELLEAEKDRADFEDDLRDKQNSLAKANLSRISASLDDSSAGRANYKQALDSYNDARSEYNEFLRDHNYDVQKEALQDFKSRQDEIYDDMKEKIQKYLDKEGKIYKDACAKVDNMNKDLKNKLSKYWHTHTTKTTAEFEHMWSKASNALKKYGKLLSTGDGQTPSVATILDKLQDKIYKTGDKIDKISSKITNTSNRISTLSNKISTYSDKIGELSSSTSTASTATTVLGDSVSYTSDTLKGYNGQLKTAIKRLGSMIGKAKELAGITPKLTSDTQNKKKNKWVVSYQGLEAYVSATTRGGAAKLAKPILIDKLRSKYGNNLAGDSQVKQLMNMSDKQLLKKLSITNVNGKFAKGTAKAPGGVTRVDEQGAYSELIPYQSGHGRYVILPKGNPVFSRDMTNNLFNFSSNPGGYLKNLALGMSQQNASAGSLAHNNSVTANLYLSVSGDAQSAVSLLKQEGQKIVDAAIQKIQRTTLNRVSRNKY